jgi:hypothetical protein
MRRTARRYGAQSDVRFQPCFSLLHFLFLYARGAIAAILQIAALRDGITAYIEGEVDEAAHGRQTSWWSKIGSGDKKRLGANDLVAERDAEDDSEDGGDGAAGATVGGGVEEGVPPPVPEWAPGSASSPLSCNLAVRPAAASSSVSTVSTVGGMTLSPYSMTTSQPYSSTSNPGGAGGVGGGVMGGGSPPPASPTPGTARSGGKIHMM